MILYSKILDRAALDALAQEVGGMVLYDVDERGTRKRGKYAGMTCIKFVLRPGGTDPEKYRMMRNTRRVWAVSWEGHRVFMDRLFTLDPGATLLTSAARYEGREGFEREHRATGDRNVGSMVQPLAYRDAC